MTAHDTYRGERIVQFIARVTDDRGTPPSIREIAEAVGLASTSATLAWLRRLTEDGRLRHESGRGYALTDPHAMTVAALELAWCQSVHGTRPPKVRPCKRHRLMAEWLVEIVLPRARSLAA